ncbi:hypothetical protein PHJA_001017400 [Phtheirospermum japonicum]|uniref:HMA domain-containing protein n=1 Tax=Phtheirospermum japonicum TaxID=374723 RepID=A0A830BMF7_9LAMI|nr:hypothetical protein PHJA_001017400 [Phtheirospermum japonicum]
MANLQIVPAGKNVEAQYVEMMVPLYSYGCEKKIKKALANLKGPIAKNTAPLDKVSNCPSLAELQYGAGIYSVNVDFHEQKVTVWGICNKCDVLTVVKKKRKGARFWNSEDDNNKIQFQETHSAPQSPQPSSSANNSKRYFAMIKRQTLKWDLSMLKHTSLLNWKSVKKAFVRSNSF